MTQLKTRIKKDDDVIVMTGKSKGARGKILEVKRLKQGQISVRVEGANKVKKTVRPNPQKGEPGGIKDQEGWINISNVKLFNAVENRGERVGYKIREDGKKVRCFKSSGEQVNADQV
jgi:large subunit ribosomal protein L24